LQFLWETNNKTGRYYYWHSNSDGQADRWPGRQGPVRSATGHVFSTPGTATLARYTGASVGNFAGIYHVHKTEINLGIYIIMTFL